jgi:hypothetical protein
LTATSATITVFQGEVVLADAGELVLGSTTAQVQAGAIVDTTAANLALGQTTAQVNVGETITTSAQVLALAGQLASITAGAAVVATAGGLNLMTRPASIDSSNLTIVTMTAGVLSFGAGGLADMAYVPWEYGTLSVVSRYEDLETGQELVTIQAESGDTWTRPSKLMQIYQMGYGDKWRKAKERRFGR